MLKHIKFDQEYRKKLLTSILRNADNIKIYFMMALILIFNILDVGISSKYLVKIYKV
jgi:hypothetical protein